jgi:hypothetical protein
MIALGIEEIGNGKERQLCICSRSQEHYQRLENENENEMCT